MPATLRPAESQRAYVQKPQPFGKYYLLERINVGGMAEVFKAKAFGVEGFERLVAVKRILPSVAQDEEFIRMFIDEAKIAVQLNHANIAQIFDLGMADGAYYIALEYVPGKDLRTLFENARKSRRPVSIAQACYSIIKICEGLDYAHNKRDGHGRELHIVHRDVSPQNVLISEEGEVKVIDFGIAKAAGRASRTKAGILKGKFGYMSPEQVRGLPLDRRSDIFSLGIILYEILTMERLFVGESDFATLEKVRNVEILPPTTYNRNIPEDLEDIALKALSRDPDDRYQTAADFHDALQRFLFTSGLFYSRKDLSDYMKDRFAEDIELEHRKLEQYRHLKAPAQGRPPGPRAPSAESRRDLMSDTFDIDTSDLIDVEAGSSSDDRSAPEPRRRAPAPGALVWDDDDDETTVYDRESEVELESEPPEVHERKPISTASEIVWAAAARRDEPPPTRDVRVRASGGRGRAAVFLGLFTFLCVGLAATFVWWVVHVRSAGGTLVLQTDPTEVEVLLDGQRVHSGRTPITLQGLSSGPHRIGVRAEGYVPGEQSIEVSHGTSGRVSIRLRKRAPTAGTLRVTTDPPGARVYIDGQLRLGLTPLVVTAVSAGRHTVTVDQAPHFVGERVVEVRAGATIDAEVPLGRRTLSVKLTSTPSGAVFRMETPEGELHAEGATPDEVGEVLSGRPYTISMTAEGRKPWTRRQTPSGLGPYLVHADLDVQPPVRVRRRQPPPVRRKPAPAAVDSEDVPPPPKPVRAPVVAAQEHGFLNLNAKPWARVFIDGRDTGQSTPMLGRKLPAGRRKITLVNSRFGIDKEYWVDIRSGRTSQLIVDLQ